MRTFTAVSAAAILLGTAKACTEVQNNQVTFYGFPDNDPPSDQVAHNCGGRNYHAGGTGTYADPLTFATAPGEFSPCELVYLPLLKKYIRYEDDCAQCTSDWKGGKHHIDLWTGNNKSGGQAQISCENELTSGGQYAVLRQPPQGLEVNSSPLWDGKCHKENVFESNKAGCSSAGASASGNSTSTDGDDSGSKGGDSGSKGQQGKGESTPTGAPSASGSAAPSKSSDSGAAATSAASTSGDNSQSGGDNNQDGSDDDEDCDDDSQDGGDDATATAPSSASGSAAPSSSGDSSAAATSAVSKNQSTNGGDDEDCDDDQQ